MVGRLVSILICLSLSLSTWSQSVPSKVEGISHLVTFGKSAPGGWGDDDHVQTFFFLLPKNYQKEFYIQIFDPNIGGDIDQKNGPFNTRVSYSVYGGNGCYSNKDARSINPKGNYKSGTSLRSKTFGSESEYDNRWYAMGPFNPLEGEYVEKYNGYVFKIIAEGISGDDGNLYSYYLSQDKDTQKEIEGGNAFTFEYSFRLNSQAGSTAHLYPFIDSEVASVKQNNFDFDNDGQMLIYSVAKNGHKLANSADGNWATGTMAIKENEKEKSLDLRIVKSSSGDNDMVIYLVNQYNQPVPFFASPLGGIPKYQYKNKIRKVISKK